LWQITFFHTFALSAARVPIDGSCAEYLNTCVGIIPFDVVGMTFVYLTWNLVIAWNEVAFLLADAFPEDTDRQSEVWKDPPDSGGAWTIVRPKRRGGVERSVDQTVKLCPRTSTARAPGNTGTEDRCTAGEATSVKTPNKDQLDGNQV
jgi:hypothetical protein